MARRCYWCRGDVEGSNLACSSCDKRREAYRSGRRTQELRNVLTKKERSIFFHQTGKRVETRDEMNAFFRENPTLRPADKGEDCYERFDALREHAETGRELDERHQLKSLDLFGDYARAKPFDIEARYREHCHRLGVTPRE